MSDCFSLASASQTASQHSSANEKQKQLMLKDGTIVTFAESTNRDLHVIGEKEKKNNDQGGFMRWRGGGGSL